MDIVYIAYLTGGIALTYVLFSVLRWFIIILLGVYIGNRAFCVRWCKPLGCREAIQKSDGRM